MKTAAAYIRVSTQEQAEYSPESQKARIRDYSAREGMLLPEEFIFTDEGISGRSDKRPAFQRMIALARRKPRPFDVVLLWKYSRFARSREDSVVYKSLLRRECGVEVLSVSEPLAADKSSVLMESLIEAMDEYYSLNLSEEVRRGMREKSLRGEPVSAPPIGYRIEGKRYVPEEEGAQTVRRIFEQFATGRSAREIAAQLNTFGLCTRRGNPFETRTVLYILKNAAYAGYLGGRQAHEPLVPWRRFEEVQRRLEAIARPQRKYERAPTGSLLQGLVRCGACGHTLVRSGGSLQCGAYAKGLCGISHSITVESIQRRVLARICRDFSGGEVALAAQAIGTGEDAAWIAAQADRARKMLQRARAAYECGADALEEFAGRKRVLQGRIQQMARMAGAREAIPGARLELAGWLCGNAVPDAERNAVLRLFVQKIVFHRAENRLEIYYY